MSGLSQGDEVECIIDAASSVNSVSGSVTSIQQRLDQDENGRINRQNGNYFKKLSVPGNI